MSILSWLLKPKKEMAKTNTKWVKVGKYNITSHAQNRLADSKRNLTKKDMLINLFGNSRNSKIYYHKNDDTYQYDRVNEKNRTITHITTKNNVKSIHKFHKKNSNKQYRNFRGNYENKK